VSNHHHQLSQILTFKIVFSPGNKSMFNPNRPRDTTAEIMAKTAMFAKQNAEQKAREKAAAEAAAEAAK
jgi:hypothetical protein